MKLWEVETGREIRTFTGHKGGVSLVAISPDGRQILSASNDPVTSLKLWDFSTGREKGSIDNVGNIRSLAISPNGKRALIGGKISPWLMDLTTGTRMITFKGHTGGVESVAFSPDGEYALSGSWDDTMKLWDVATGREIRTFKRSSEYLLEMGDVLSVAFSPDGKYALYGTYDQALKLWDIETGEEVRTFKGHTGAVSFTAFSPDSKMIYSGSTDGTIRLWNVSDGREIALMTGFTDGEWITITPEGYFTSSPNGGKHLNIRISSKDRNKIPEVLSIDKFYNTFYRPDLVEAKLKGKDISQYARNINLEKVFQQGGLPPSVKFLTRSGISDDKDITIKTEFCDKGGGIGDITIYLNDMPIVVETGGRGIKIIKKTSGAEQCYSFEKLITLQNGENIISIMAYNKTNTIESEISQIELIYKISKTFKPDMYILAVAINNYRDVDLRLKYSINDSEELVKTVNATAAPLYDKIHVYKIYNEEAIKEKIEKTFEEIGKKTRRDDVFLLFVAGHGITNEKDGAYYFLPVNFRYTDEEAITMQGVSMNDFKKYLTNIQAMKSLLLLDTCNSGSFAEAIASRGMIEKTAITKLTKAVGRATIVASSKSQVALEGYEGHGVFTYTVIDALKGKAADKEGKITINGLATYVEDLLPKLTYRKWGYEQIPQKTLHGMDFPLALTK